MSNPAPVGLGPDEDERVAAFQYGRFSHEDGMATWPKLSARERKARRRSVREAVDALRGCGYRVEKIAEGGNGLRCTDEAFGFRPEEPDDPPGHMLPELRKLAGCPPES